MQGRDSRKFLAQQFSVGSTFSSAPEPAVPFASCDKPSVMLACLMVA